MFLLSSYQGREFPERKTVTLLPSRDSVISSLPLASFTPVGARDVFSSSSLGFKGGPLSGGCVPFDWGPSCSDHFVLVSASPRPSQTSRRVSSSTVLYEDLPWELVRGDLESGVSFSKPEVPVASVSS